MVNHIPVDRWLSGRRHEVDLIGERRGFRLHDLLEARETTARLRERANPQDRT